jgi:Tfp pilus assembly protein PilN
MNQILNNHIDKIQERIMYLEQQIAAGSRLDGYSLEGHIQELKQLKEELKDIDNKNDNTRT